MLCLSFLIVTLDCMSHFSVAPLIDLLKDGRHVIGELPCRILRLEAGNIRHPPNVVSPPILFFVRPREFAAADLPAKVDRFQHRAVTLPAASDIEDLPRPAWTEEEFAE